MTRNEFIKLLKDNLKPNAEMDFLLIDRFDDGRPISAFLDIRSVGMNVDIVYLVMVFIIVVVAVLGYGI